MGRILDAITLFFKDDDWPYQFVNNRPLVKSGFSGDNGQWTCYAQERAEQEQIAFYSVCPIRVPVDQRPVVAEFITRSNYGLISGNFEMSYETGEVRYKTSLDVEDEELTGGLIHHLVYTNVHTMDRYLPGLIRVIYGGLSPEEAVAEVENC